MADREDQIVLRKRARRRLVGAIALVTFVVIVLPMVFDKEPKPISRDISIQIPNPDASAFQNKVVPVPPRVVPQAAVPAPGPAGASPAAERPVASGKASPDVPVGAVQAKPDALSGAKILLNADVKPVLKAEAKPGAEGESRPEARAAAKSAEKTAISPGQKASSPKAPGAVAPATGKTAAGPASPTGTWVVKLGAFADKENANRLQARLKAAGIQSYTESTESAQGPRTRVRAGPFATRSAAERAQEKLKKLGVNGAVDQK
jgi:DedD protein